MAQNTTIGLDADTWTQLTDADVTAITFQNRGSGDIYIEATVGAVAPTDFDGSILYRKGEGEANVLLSSLMPGVSGANRVYAYAVGEPADVFVSHA